MTRFLRVGAVAAACLAATAAAGCHSFLDVNQNPNAPETVSEYLQLPGIEGVFGYGVIGSYPSALSAEWMQQIAYLGERQNQKQEKYEVQETEMDRVWNASYDQVMNNARQLSSQAEASGDNAYAAVAKILFAWDLAIVTDMWGPVPYSQAWTPTNPAPQYDTQQQVYAAVFKTLDEAIAQLDKPSNRAPGRDDLLYGGDLAKWRRLAYTLEGRFNLQLSTAPGENTQSRAQAAIAALQKGFASNADDADFKYYDVANQRNPWYGTQQDPNLRMAKQYVDLLTGLADPRLAVQAAPAPKVVPAGTYVGEPNGGERVDTGLVSPIGKFYNAPNAVLTWISYADAKMALAEATLLASGAGAADAPYRDAIRAHMQKLGVPAAAAEAYVAARPALGGVADAHGAIMTQKYIINYLNYQAWNDWRRTGYPRLTPVANATLPSIPVRFRAPATELSTNAASLAAAGTPIGSEAMLQRVWWDPQ